MKAKPIATLLAVLGLSVFTAGVKAEISLNNEETLSCKVILCTLVPTPPEANSECRKAILDWAKYQAKFWKKPSLKCPRYDQNENLLGYQELKCSQINDEWTKETICTEDGGTTEPPSNCNNGGGTCEWEEK